MWPALKKRFLLFFTDETFFLRAMRSIIMAGAASGAMYADQVGQALGAPGAVKAIKVGSLLCMGLALMLGAGDKTPEEVKALAKTLTAPSAP